MITAAGIVFLTDSGKVLLALRSDNGLWAFPGGHIEDGETPEEAARREIREEIGVDYQGDLAHLADAGNFRGFLARVPEQFSVTLNDENNGARWIDHNDLPEPMLPGAWQIINRLNIQNELDVMRAIAAGDLTSPQYYGNMWLWALRITGTGTAYRSKIDETCYRPPEEYLNDEFLARCNGLPVIWHHPKGNLLDSEEYHDRTVGSICLPYIKGDEVWGVARIYDEDCAIIMQSEQMSTSPAVEFAEGTNQTIELSDGRPLLIEGKTVLLDHLAICQLGVWDKGEAPEGVQTDNLEGDMPDVKKQTSRADDNAAVAEPTLADVLKAIQDIGSRVESLEKGRTDNMPGEPLNVADSEGEKRKEEEEEKEEAKRKADDDAKRKADDDDKAKRKDDDDKARADAALLREELAAMKAQLASMKPVELTDADKAAIAAAQTRADAVGQALGISISGPMIGESAMSYRKRLAGQFKQYSKEFGKVDLSSVRDDSLFDVLEGRIYADAQAAAMTPEFMPKSGLREIISNDATGRKISTFVGDFKQAFGQFMAPTRRVIGFNKQ